MPSLFPGDQGVGRSVVNVTQVWQGKDLMGTMQARTDLELPPQPHLGLRHSDFDGCGGEALADRRLKPRLQPTPITEAEY